MKPGLLIVLLFPVFAFQAQADSVVAPGRLPDGVYLRYEDFRHNRGIPKESLQSSLPEDQLDYVGKIMSEEVLHYRQGGQTSSIPTEKVWGYVQNNTLYLNYKSEFYRVPVFGAISYFVAKVLMVTPGYYDPRFGYPVGNTRSQEVREFLFDFYSGEIREFSHRQAEELLKRDETLYAEFSRLGRRKQKEQVYRYIRRFNELHPVYFLR